MKEEFRDFLVGIFTGLIAAVVNKIIRKTNLLKGVKMEIDIIDGQIGSVGSYDVEFKEGKLKGFIKVNSPVGINGSLGIEFEAAIIIEALKKAIPGQVDDAIFDVIKKALESQKA